MNEIIKKSLESHRRCLESIERCVPQIERVSSIFIDSLRKNGKIIFAGNGGSASDSQHLAAELVGRFKENRNALGALALSVNTSILTAVGNDFGFEEIFSRQIEALASTNDAFMAISTSGNSQNLINAVKKAKEMKVVTIGLLGKNGGKLKSLVDTALVVDCDDTPRIQEIHITIGHILCEIVEYQLK
ncbi:MAG: D-sedoheptulose 7-phosphate isomerase [Candidatus Omnitrophota bacterium]